jgi:hypothetical protein
MASEAAVANALRAALASGNQPLAAAIAQKWQAEEALVKVTGSEPETDPQSLSSLSPAELNALDPADPRFAGVQAVGPSKEALALTGLGGLGVMAAPAVGGAALAAGRALGPSAVRGLGQAVGAGAGFGGLWALAKKLGLVE